MTVVIKKEEKVNAILDILGDEHTEEKFAEEFKKEYPQDWERIKNTYEEEKRQTKPGKTHPMPHPDVYVRNMYKTAVKKRNMKG